MSTLSVLIFACIIFANFGQFHKIKYTQNFLLNDIRENKYMLNMRKIHNSRKKEKNTQKRWVNTAFY